MERITIVGVGPVGVSIGLALMKRRLNNTEIVITSGDRAAMSAAKDMQAANQTISSMRNAVEGAHLIILDTPVAEMRDTMDSIGPYMEREAVVTDTCSVKTPVLRWANEFLPKDADFIGGHPLLKSPPHHMETASADIFKDTKYSIAPSDSAGEQSIRTVVGLVEALGATPVFLDPAEHDSYAAAMHHLPVILSSAFVTATAGSEGWREMHLLAESQFDAFGKHAANDPIDNEAVCLASRDALVHWIDQLILELYNYRNELKEDNDDLLERFIKAWEYRAKWESDAVVPREGTDLPTASEAMMSALMGERLARRLRVIRDRDEDKDTTYVRRNR